MFRYILSRKRCHTSVTTHSCFRCEKENRHGNSLTDWAWQYSRSWLGFVQKPWNPASPYLCLMVACWQFEENQSHCQWPNRSSCAQAGPSGWRSGHSRRRAPCDSHTRAGVRLAPSMAAPARRTDSSADAPHTHQTGRQQSLINTCAGLYKFTSDYKPASLCCSLWSFYTLTGWGGSL